MVSGTRFKVLETFYSGNIMPFTNSLEFLKRMTEGSAKKIKKSDDGLIRPRKSKSDPCVGPDALMVLVRSDLEYMISCYPSGKTTRYDMRIFQLFRIMTDSNGPLFLSGPFLGAPHAVMGMEKLIALGAIRIWALGWCGSLQPRSKIGDLVIPDYAHSEEGTSRHYPIGESTPTASEEMIQLIEKTLKNNGQIYSRGDVWTTDAPYRETPEKVEFYQKRGVLAVEMEMSALMTLAHFRGVKFGALLVVSDELFNLKWHADFSNPKLKSASRHAGEVMARLAAFHNG